MSRATVPNSSLRAAGKGTEGYGTKLAKYVPVEGLAPAIAVAQVAKDNDAMLWITWIVAFLVGIGAIAAQVRSATEKGETKPGWYFWPFVCIGFVAWSLGASAYFRGLVSASDQFSDWFLALAAFGLPGLELLFDRE